jgi:CHAT domain-containing protein
MAIMEKQRGELAINMLKETFLFNRQALYEALIELLAEEGDYKGALETAERAKAWGIVDLLAGKNIGKNSVEAELIKQDKNYINEMADGYRKVLAAAGGDFAWKKALDKIEKAENAHRDVIIKIKAQNEELYSLLFVESVNTDDIRQLLDKNTTLFSYYITDKVLYIWAINKDRVHLERIKITREEVAKLISSFIAAIIAKDKKQAGSLSEKVYSIFLKPVIPFVSGDRIGFIPHGPLHYLPFAAMSYKGQYLVEGFSIFYLPNAGVLKYVLKKKQPAQSTNVLAFANPDLGNKQLDLPYAEAEVESIRKIIPQATIFLREEVTKTKAKAMIGSYDIVHFAARGLFVEDAPMNSGILLTPAAQDDGTLTAAEIFKLQFRGRVVVISACKTAPGISSTGEGIVALNRSFLYAGSPSVVTTIWNVDDNSTATFMDIFYRNLEKNESIADSLRVTQNEMIRLGYTPFDWAAFILTGKY